MIGVVRYIFGSNVTAATLTMSLVLYVLSGMTMVLSHGEG